MSAMLCQVYAIAFNNPWGDRVATGSFDKTARLWDVNSGECLHTLRGGPTQHMVQAERHGVPQQPHEQGATATAGS
jgi:WD40 repeat protein